MAMLSEASIDNPIPRPVILNAYIVIHSNMGYVLSNGVHNADPARNRGATESDDGSVNVYVHQFRTKARKIKRNYNIICNMNLNT